MSRTFIYRVGWNRAPAEACVRACAGFECTIAPRLVCARSRHDGQRVTHVGRRLVGDATRPDARAHTHKQTCHKDACAVFYATSHTIGQEHRACACSIDRCGKITRRWPEETKKNKCNSDRRATSVIKMQQASVVLIHSEQITETFHSN